MKEIYEKFKDELLNSCVPFWLNNGVDKEYGGLINCLDRNGKVYSDDKSVWMQGRCGWMFSYIDSNANFYFVVFNINESSIYSNGRRFSISFHKKA